MLILILFLIIGSFLVYISRFNFMPVTVNFGFYEISDVPLFYVIVGTLIFGLMVSYLVYLVQAISNVFKFRGKDNEIKKAKEEVEQLTQQIHQLELENERLKKPPLTVKLDEPKEILLK